MRSARSFFPKLPLANKPAVFSNNRRNNMSELAELLIGGIGLGFFIAGLLITRCEARELIRKIPWYLPACLVLLFAYFAYNFAAQANMNEAAEGKEGFYLFGGSSLAIFGICLRLFVENLWPRFRRIQKPE
jgi:hypothetical protein